jgi:hypothetical protein
MTCRTLFSAVALATLALLSACGGGEASDSETSAQPQSVGGIGGSGVASQAIGGIGGSGVLAQGIGGIGGSGLTSQAVGGIGGSGVAAQGIGGIGGSGVTSQGVGGIGGSGVVAQAIGGIGGSGVMSVASAQTCGLQSVNVTVASVRVNQNGAANANSSGWVDVALASPVRVDLVALASGAPLPIDLTTLPSGTYRQMRLLPVGDDAATPLANSVVTKNRIETALAVPDAAQGGLPLATALTVSGGQVSGSLQGLAVCQAVAMGATGNYEVDAVQQGATQVASAL